MSELQRSLLFAGVVVIVLVWVLNQIQLWRVRQREARQARHYFAAQKKWHEGDSHRQEPVLEGVAVDSNDGYNLSDEPLVQTTFSARDEEDELDWDKADEEILALTEHTEINLPAVTEDKVDSAAVINLDESEQFVVPPIAVETPLSSERGAAMQIKENASSETSTQALVPDVMPAENIQTVSQARNKETVIDSLIDCVIPLEFDYPVPAERILPLLSHLRHVGNKVISCEGLNLETQSRQTICAGQRYQAIYLAVQLANRHGALNALEFSEFANGVQQFAHTLESKVVLPETPIVLAAARELDAFSQENDIQLTIHVQTRSRPFVASEIYARLLEDGLVLARDGSQFTYYHMHEETPKQAFTVRFSDCNFLQDDLSYCRREQIELCFDAPRSVEEIRPLRLMWLYAGLLAKNFDAVIVDDHGHLLAESALMVIESRLKEIYARLRQRGIVAGSSSALRLFSV